MATRSNIALYNEKTKQLTSIYCHWDGYIENNGKLLNKFYNSIEKVQELMNLGDLSSLGEFIAGPDGANICEFYGRDRNEDEIEAKVFNDVNFADLTKFRNEEYFYVFTKDGWLVSGHGTNGLKPLADFL